MRGTVGPLWLAWLATAGAAGGCSLLDEVGGGVLSFALPEVTFQIATTDPRWWPCPPERAGGIPDVVCRGTVALVTDCCQPPAPMVALDCQEYPLSCDDDDMCALAFDYDDAVEINLGRDVLALQQQHHLVLAQATVDQIDTTMFGPDAGADALPLRAVSLWVAPRGTTSAPAAGAVFLADVPFMPGEGPVDLAADARLAFSTFLADFNTPFALILSSHVVVKSGPVPTGTATFIVGGRVNASF